MKVFLAGENGKAKILRLYDSIFSKRSIEDSMQAISRTTTDRQTDRQTDRADERLLSRRTEWQSIAILSEHSKQASKRSLIS